MSNMNISTQDQIRSGTYKHRGEEGGARLPRHVPVPVARPGPVHLESFQGKPDFNTIMFSFIKLSFT